jgi:large conductance mechanosensitive channel
MTSSFLKEFRDFAIRGSVVDMAVGVIIGTAFGKITSSFVNDIIMPPLGLLVSKVNFGQLCFDLTSMRFCSLDEAKLSAATINIGKFCNTVIDFFIQAIAIFLVIKAIQNLKTKTALIAGITPLGKIIPQKTKSESQSAQEQPEPITKECPFCCSQIPIKAKRCPECTSIIEEENLMSSPTNSQAASPPPQ